MSSLVDTSSIDVALPAFKVVVVGDAGVGKSALVRRLAYDVFVDDQLATIGVDFLDVRVTLDDSTSVRLQLWDTAGQERYNTTLSSAYMRNAAAALYVYDADSMRSIDTLARWVRDCEHRHGRAPVRFVVGTKCDLPGVERTDAAGAEFSAAIGADRHCRCSAKTGDGVADTFRVLAERLRYMAVERALSASPPSHRSESALDLARQHLRSTDNETCAC